jgi:hypothetical protein
MLIIVCIIGLLLGLITAIIVIYIQESNEYKKESKLRRECSKEYYSAKLDCDEWINEQYIKLQKRLSQKRLYFKIKRPKSKDILRDYWLDNTRPNFDRRVKMVKLKYNIAKRMQSRAIKSARL